LKIYDLKEPDISKLARFFSKLPPSSWNSKTIVSLLRNQSYEIKVIYEYEEIIALILSNFVSNECNLLYIGVVPSSQKKGAGGLLVNNLISDCKARGFEKIQLEVRKNNHSAIFLYEKNGFDLDGLRKNYYPDGDHREDALLYTYYLDKD
jgi:ribosomal-protein-alanine acetyltransferase